MQIESGSFENEALQKKYYIWSQICGVQKTQKYGKLRPPKIWKTQTQETQTPPKKSDQKTQTPTPTGKTKSTHLPCTFENLMGKGLNGMEKLFVS